MYVREWLGGDGGGGGEWEWRVGEIRKKTIYWKVGKCSEYTAVCSL